MILGAALLYLVAHAAPFDERTLAAFVVLTPSRATGAPPFGELLASVETPLLELTGLRLRSPEQLGLDPAVLGRCRDDGNPACVARHVGRASPAEVAVVLTLLPFASHQHRVSMALIDVAQAVELSRVGGADDPSGAEDELYAASPRLEATVLDARDAEALASWIESGLRPQSAAPDARPWLKPCAALDLGALQHATEILVDGVPFGTRGPGEGLVTGLRPGVRQLSLWSTGLAVEAWVELEHGRTTRFQGQVVVQAPPSRPWSPARAFLPGGGLIASGATALVAGAVLAGSGEDTKQRAAWATASGLIGAGVTWLVLETVFSDDDRPIWIDAGLTVIVGVGVGITSVLASSPEDEPFRR